MEEYQKHGPVPRFCRLFSAPEGDVDVGPYGNVVIGGGVV